MELLIARNPDPDSSLPFLLRLPLGADGLVFRTKGTWPRTTALYCHQVPPDEWPDRPDVVERVPLMACRRRGAAIDVVADRRREQRSQLVFTRARGRDVVFWQSPRTRQSRPNVRLPTARASGIPELEIVVDAHERYPYRFSAQQAGTVTRGLPCGDYAVEVRGRVVAAVERKSLADLVSSLTSGRLRYALGELAALPRAAVVVEGPYAKLFSHEHVRPAVIADGLAELQVRWPSVPIAYCGSRQLAEEWTYRYLAAARAWALEDATVAMLVGDDAEEVGDAPATTPSAAEVRAWAREQDIVVADRGRIPADVLDAWHAAHRP